MYDLKFADIGEGLHEGQILKWLFKVGDTVNEGDTVVIIETDKVNAEIPAPVTGVIKKLGAEVGETIHVGETLVIIDDGTGGELPKEESKPEAKAEPSSSVEENAGVVGEIEVGDEVIASVSEEATNEVARERTLATPVARRMASEAGLDINKIKGTGENGRVTREDVLAATSKSTPAPTAATPAKQPVVAANLPTEGVTRVPITKLRKAIVNSMVTSKAMIPHTVLMEEINVTKLAEFRKEYKDFAASHGVKLTFMPFIVKAVLLAIKEYPIFNASYDHEREEIVYHNNLNIGIAVDTPDGLIVPNIKNADRLSLLDLAREIEKLGKQANDRSLQLPQIQGGTFTVTNYGAFDSSFGTPIIKYPEVAIIGIGRINKKPVVVNNELAVGDVLPISLAVDHRIVDGADAGRFIMKFKEYITNPMLLLMS
ncbi:MAG: dihydrolipoamide acetyltransferase family protein [Bacilli bacterium]|nr:2-oxo acid dehydrogenase subunit E2 [Bacilli bacterium]